MNILVTGASNGIGEKAAALLMEQGANVALHYFSNPEKTEALVKSYSNVNAKSFGADLCKKEETLTLWDTVIDHFGHLDAIVLNAGVFEEHPLELSDENWMDIWEHTMAVNLTSAGLLTKKGIEHFRKRGGGRFIYIGSRAAFRGETEEYLAYAASKGGLTSLGKTVARSFGKDNIKSFVIAPGFVQTRMVQDFIDKYGKEKVLDELSLNELTKPEHLAPLIGLLCSGLLDHATGTTIDFNAGSHIR